MIKYGDLVEYIKANHINWNTDLFDVLRGFFDSKYSLLTQYSPPSSFSVSKNASVVTPPAQQELIFDHQEFHEPTDKHYTTQDLINLLEA